MLKDQSSSSVVLSMEEMNSFRNEWTEIYEQNAVKPHYLSFEFISLWFKCFALPSQARIFRIVSDGITIGFLPLVIKKDGYFKILKSLTNAHCMHSGPLVRDGYLSLFKKLLFVELSSNYSSWDVFTFDYVYSFDRNSSLFCDDVLTNIQRRWQKRTTPTYVTSLTSGYENYISSMSKNWRNNINKWARRLMKSGQSRFVCYQGTEGLLHWPELLRLEDSGWKGENGSSLMRIGSNYQNYYLGLIDILGRSGDLRLFFLELNGLAIAGGFGYIENNTFHYWKTGFDAKYQNLSPSNQLFLFVVKNMIDDSSSVTNIHAFTGDFGYKHRYSNEEAVSSTFIIYNRTIFGWMACYFDFIKKAVKGNEFGYRIVMAIKKIINNR
jgi:CelD/BcsL family acetyltransferase involved in cellulose biosynthesis